MPKATARTNVQNVKEPGGSAPLSAPTGDEPGAGMPVDESDALDAQVSDTSDVDVPKADPKPAPKVDLTDPAQLAAFIDAKVEKGVAAKLAERAAVSGKAVKEAELPDQSEIDATKIRKPVLSKQGYVVPPDMGARPSHLQNLT